MLSNRAAINANIEDLPEFMARIQELQNAATERARAPRVCMDAKGARQCGHGMNSASAMSTCGN
jgi:hypothetical protein